MEIESRETDWVWWVYGWDLDTTALLPDHYCADSGSKWHYQGGSPGIQDILVLFLYGYIWSVDGMFVNVCGGSEHDKPCPWTLFGARMLLCSVFCQTHKPDPKGEMQVHQTCGSELKLHNLSLSPPSMISSACHPPFCASPRPSCTVVMVITAM